ncbi:MAG: hypothetical protein F4158_00345, partial [Synechococcus sp. SB0675_bin_7]|nr:hypothetical protein [Synechococcus sp. SB0675_bin_7]
MAGWPDGRMAGWPPPAAPGRPRPVMRVPPWRFRFRLPSSRPESSAGRPSGSSRAAPSLEGSTSGGAPTLHQQLRSFRRPLPVAGLGPTLASALLSLGLHPVLAAPVLLGSLSMLAVLAPPAVAQTTLLSNTGQTEASTAYAAQSGVVDLAQRIRTGSHAAGYDLDSVVLKLVDIGSTPTVTIQENDTDNNPVSSVLYTLTNPSTLTAGLNEFSAPDGATLAANTDYWVVLKAPGNPVTWRLSGTADLDAGAAAGWQIFNEFIDIAFGGVTLRDNSLQLQVKGTAIVTIVTAPVTLAPETLSVAEDGGTGTYTVVLDTQPTDGVTVTLTAGTGVTVDTDSVSTGNQNTLMFTTSNWNTAQTVTVTGVNDAVDNPGGRSVSIGHAASSTDSNYVIADAGSVTVTVTDDEATTVTLAGAAGDVTEGSSKTFTVTLGRGLVSGESLAVPLSFGGTATRGTDYTVTGAAATGVTYQNLDSGSATVTFTGPDSGATATTATLTLSATTDSVTESSGETVDISLGTLSANSGTGLGGGASGTDNLAEFSITDADTAPTVATAIGDQSATEGASFTFVVPAGTFTDADGDTLSYTATQADAAALPDWLSFDAATRTFSGTPAAADVGTLSVKVTASDGKGGTASDTFDIVVTGLTAVTIDTDLGGVLKAAGPVTVTITFSAAVTGFAETDLAVVRGTVSDFTEVTSGTVWTVVLTPNPDFNGRSVILTIPAGAAADANSNGNKKAQMSIIYEARLQAPAAFTVTPGNTQVTLAWSAPANDGIGTAAVSKYQYQYHRNSAPWVWWRDVPDSDGNKALDDETSFAVTGLTNGVIYNFRVRAVNGAGDGFATAILSTTPTAADTVAPTVSSITRQSTHGGGKTNADSLVWR